MPAVTVVSVKVVVLVLPLLAGAVSIRANEPGKPVADRSMTKPPSLLALSRHCNLTCGPACRVATRFVGAAGAAVGRFTPIVA